MEFIYYYVFKRSFKDICLLLSDNGADISIQDKDGDTPLALTNDPSIKDSITSIIIIIIIIIIIMHVII